MIHTSIKVKFTYYLSCEITIYPNMGLTTADNFIDLQDINKCVYILSHAEFLKKNSGFYQ
jgi:hypothetical protein